MKIPCLFDTYHFMVILLQFLFTDIMTSIGFIIKVVLLLIDLEHNDKIIFDVRLRSIVPKTYMDTKITILSGIILMNL